MSHHRSTIRSFLVVLSILALLIAGSANPVSAALWVGKVDPWVLQTASAGSTEFLVYLSIQADLSPAARLSTKAQKGEYVYQQLTSTAERTQKPLLVELRRLGVRYQPFWIANMILVKGDLSTIQVLAGREDVAHLYANPHVALDAPLQATASKDSTQAVEWNLVKVGAPQVWAKGYTGQGVVVGAQDTGFQWDNPALKNKYRGWDGSAVHHDYSWFDATPDPSTTPVDPFGHGTPVMGTIVGDDGQGNQIGMAPGARWIGCRNMDRFGVGTPATYAACYQWFVAPTRVDGSAPRPDKSPDVINNSWSCTQAEGCTDPEVLLTAVQSLRAAGIATIHSAGNSGGSGCGTVNQPAAIYAESFTVGATDSTDTIASFSGKGPVTVDGSNRTKPDISAPGVNVRSCTTSGGYSLMTGTSIATPQVTGLVALLLSAYPALRGQVDQIENIIEQSALHIPSSDCSSSGVPNNLYGWGRIDALAAYQKTHLLLLSKRASSVTADPGDLITYTLTISHLYGTDPTTHVVLTDTIPLQSTFVSATTPFLISGGIVRWEFSALAPQASTSVKLVVAVDSSASGRITNENYAVYSDQVSWSRGTPVSVFLGEVYFLPITLRNP